jgi:phosphocarrier protein
MVAKDGTVSLRIAWGERNPFRAYLDLPIASQVATGPDVFFRNTSNELVRLVDIDDDGDVDAVTSLGVARNGGGRVFSWEPFESEPPSARKVTSPVAILQDEEDRPVLIRALQNGNIVSCPLGAACVPFATDELLSTNPVEELVTADFDSDGQSDLLVGRRGGYGSNSDASARFETRLYLSSRGFRNPVVTPGMHGVDIEVADIDNDGRLDVVSQRDEDPTESPSYTIAWHWDGAKFSAGENVRNWDRHNDPLALVDVDGDRCVDLVMIGASRPAPGFFFGDCTGKFAEDQRRTPRLNPAANTSSGIQAIDLNGDGVVELVSREAHGGRGLRIFSLRRAAATQERAGLRTTLTISNKLGVYSRAAAKLAQLAGTYSSEIWMTKGGRRVNAKSTSGVLTLAVRFGDRVEIETSGADERAAMNGIVALINNKFGERE